MTIIIMVEYMTIIIHHLVHLVHTLLLMHLHNMCNTLEYTAHYGVTAAGVLLCLFVCNM